MGHCDLSLTSAELHLLGARTWNNTCLKLAEGANETNGSSGKTSANIKYQDVSLGQALKVIYQNHLRVELMYQNAPLKLFA